MNVGRERAFAVGVLAALVVLSGRGYSPGQEDPEQEVRGKDTVCVSPAATVLWYNQPSAVYFEGRESRTYFAHMSESAEVFVGAYDHKARALLGPT